MIDDDFFLSLPADPEEAFVLYEEHVRNKCLSLGEERQDDECERRYINYIAYLDQYGIDIGITDVAIPTQGSDFWNYYRNFRLYVEHHVAQFKLRRLRQLKSGTSGVYILSPSLKMEIHHYIERIREILANLELSPQKRDALANKLNAFAAEVDRDRTKIDAIAAALIWTKREIKDGVDILSPILSQIERIIDKFGKAKEIESLPPPDRRDKLEAPPKRIEPPKPEKNIDDLDDEIPF